MKKQYKIISDRQFVVAKQAFEADEEMGPVNEAVYDNVKYDLEAWVGGDKE